MLRRLAVLSAACLTLAACADGARELERPMRPLGDFRLGHAVVTAPNIVQGPASRKASGDEWIEAMDAALEERFRRYQGDQLYHLGVSVEGFVLAQPGIPIVFSPKSVVIVRVSVLKDGVYETVSEARLNPEAEEITALEAPSPETIVGSGVTQSKAEQLENLSKNAALQIEKWMRRQAQSEGWFGGADAVAEETAEEAEAATTSDTSGDAAEGASPPVPAAG
ncbi:hypothetical protein LVO79_12775 [Roseivivax marinus]|uniref:hypothetical protein n=1 Tax=Roseivivax marinus TaxID=1379903 RepID=UPI001F035975|nr:hypothetical protein [Roseivivax marinus]UMA63898.1 hypothetical protein LVO79_12775 [Roseivivax marinus]